MRELITGIVTLLFIVSYNIYVLDSQFVFFDCIPCKKTMLTTALGVFVISLIMLGNHNRKTAMEIDLRRFAFGSFLTYCVINILHYQYIITNPFKLIYLFNGANFAIILLILYNAHKFGFLKNGR